MELITYLDLRSKVERDLDLESEDFIQPEEMLGYANEAVDICEAEIHKLGMEDEYFLSNSDLSLLNGQAEYDLPADIYANKIRRIVYSVGTTIFTINRMRNRDKFELAEEMNRYPPSNWYCYMIINKTAGVNPKMLLVPPAKESGVVGKIWYIRNANKLVDDTSVCDIPEFQTFIVKYMKWKCLLKEGNPMAQEAKEDLEQERLLMVQTLENMVPDEDSRIQMDNSFYEDMS